MAAQYQFESHITNGNETLVVRCSSLEDLIAARQMVIDTLIHPQEEKPKDFCTIHNCQMVLWVGTSGKEWYDHRWQEGDEGTWYRCNGRSISKNTADAQNGTKQPAAL